MEITNIRFVFGNSPIFRFTLKTPEDVTGWTTELRIYHNGTLLLTRPGAITDPSMVPNSTANGVFDVTMPAAAYTSTLVPNVNYKWAFWRTNTGFEDTLAAGELRLPNDYQVTV